MSAARRMSSQADVVVVAGRWLGMVHVTPRHVKQITRMRGCWTSHVAAAVATSQPRVTKADFSWRYPRPRRCPCPNPGRGGGLV